MIARTARRQSYRLGLAIFLPLHFLTLGLALDGEARLEGFLRWTDAPMVKLGEGALIFLLAVHALGGLGKERWRRWPQ
jgi:fumarate reductase subunit D